MSTRRASREVGGYTQLVGEQIPFFFLSSVLPSFRFFFLLSPPTNVSRADTARPTSAETLQIHRGRGGVCFGGRPTSAHGGTARIVGEGTAVVELPSSSNFELYIRKPRPIHKNCRQQFQEELAPGCFLGLLMRLAVPDTSSGLYCLILIWFALPGFSSSVNYLVPQMVCYGCFFIWVALPGSSHGVYGRICYLACSARFLT